MLLVRYLHLGSASFSRIFDWYFLVGVLWSCVTSVKPLVSPFELELLIRWVVALSTSPLSSLYEYLRCSFSLQWSSSLVSA